MVQNAQDLLRDPQLSRMFWSLKHAELGPVQSLGQAFVLSKLSEDACTPAPCLGEHTEYACRHLLGMSDEEFIELFTSGVFE